MKNILGLLLIFAGVALGLYLGVWVCFVGGIVDIVNQLKSPATTVSAWVVGFGIFKIICAGGIGWISALILIIPGFAFLDE